MTTPVKPRHVVRLITGCGCTRDLTSEPPFKPEFVVALLGHMTSMLAMDSTAMHALFENDPVVKRKFAIHSIERPDAYTVVGIYHEVVEKPNARN